MTYLVSDIHGDISAFRCMIYSHKNMDICLIFRNDRTYILMKT